MTNKQKPQIVPLGTIYATTRALHALGGDTGFLKGLLNRYLAHDWGECGDEERRANDEAVLKGGRVLATYRGAYGEKIWIITEADRSATRILLPDEA